MVRLFKYHFIAICLLCLFSCVKETADDQLIPMSFTIGSTTKTILDGTDVLWESGDQVAVYDRVGVRCFTTEDTGTSATFHGGVKVADNYIVMSPYNSELSVNGEVVYAVIPTVQQARLNSFGRGASISVGKMRDADKRVTLQNVTALISVNVDPGIHNISSIRFTTASGEKISGKFSLDMSTDNIDVNLSERAADYVELTGPFVKGTYYFAVSPSEISGFILRCTLPDGRYYERKGTNPLTLNPGDNINLGTFSIDNPDSFIEENIDNSSDPVSKYVSSGIDFSRITELGHPRLFMTAEEFCSLRERVVAVSNPDDIYYKLHNLLMNEARYRLKNDPLPEYKLSSEKLLEQSRNALTQLFHYSYAFRMTGEIEFLDSAKEIIAAVCAFPNWNASNHFLDPSEMALAVAVAYDWLYYDLSLEERQKIHQALVNYMLEPFQNYYPATDSNWNQVCNGGAIAAAIVLYDKNKSICGNTIDKAIESNLKAVDIIYNPNGNGIEGVGYWDYAMMYQAVIINALDCGVGTDAGISATPGLIKSPEWYMYSCGPTGPFNYSDSARETNSIVPIGMWAGAKYSRTDMLTVQKKLIELKGVDRIGNRITPLVLCGMQHYGYIDEDAEFPTKAIWSANDKSPIVMVRQGWNFDDTDTYFGFKGSGGVNNHSHMDAGTFVYDAFGVRWACDIPLVDYSGYDDVSLFDMYQWSTRWDVLCANNYFHNTLSFTQSGKGSILKLHSTDQIIGSIGELLDVYDSDTDGYGGKMDLSCHYSDFASSVYRTVKIKGDELYVIDEITAKSSYSAPFEWRMITKSEIECNGNVAVLTSNGKKMYLRTSVSSSDADEAVYGKEDAIERPSSWSDRSWDNAQDYSKYRVVKYSGSVPAGTTAIYTTVFSPTEL